MFRGLVNFLASKTAATAVEYALLASCIALAILVAVTSIGTNLSTSYSEIGAAFR